LKRSLRIGKGIVKLEVRETFLSPNISMAIISINTKIFLLNNALKIIIPPQ
jgi:hypothetical protein